MFAKKQKSNFKSKAKVKSKERKWSGIPMPISRDIKFDFTKYNAGRK